MQILPHREPILLVDEVAELVPGKHISAFFHIDPKMEIFKGHFPDHPVFPGAYTLESMGQASALLIQSDKQFRGMLPLFYGTNRVRFIRKVSPGETLKLFSQLSGIDTEKKRFICSATAYVGKETAAVAELILSIR